jgi:cytochrome b involved in lipid metabolism
MRVSFRTELIFGLVSSFIIFMLLMVTIFRYEQQITQLGIKQNPQVDQTEAMLTIDEISKHSQTVDCWIMISDKVYDATDYLEHHPGGANEIIPYCGRDATQAYLTQGGRGSHSPEALKQLGYIYVGELNGKTVYQPNTDAIRSLPVGGEDDD